MYIFKKTSISTVIDVQVFMDRYGAECNLVTREIISTYKFGGIPLLETLSSNRPKIESSTFVTILDSPKLDLPSRSKVSLHPMEGTIFLVVLCHTFVGVRQGNKKHMATTSEIEANKGLKIPLPLYSLGEEPDIEGPLILVVKGSGLRLIKV